MCFPTPQHDFLFALQGPFVLYLWNLEKDSLSNQPTEQVCFSHVHLAFEWGVDLGQAWRLGSAHQMGLGQRGECAFYIWDHC